MYFRVHILLRDLHDRVGSKHSFSPSKYNIDDLNMWCNLISSFKTILHSPAKFVWKWAVNIAKKKTTRKKATKHWTICSYITREKRANPKHVCWWETLSRGATNYMRYIRVFFAELPHRIISMAKFEIYFAESIVAIGRLLVAKKKTNDLRQKVKYNAYVLGLDGIVIFFSSGIAQSTGDCATKARGRSTHSLP